MIATLDEKQHTRELNPATEVASLEGVSKNYGQVRALCGVNFTVRAGEVVALLGPNGAGKTTAVKLLLGLMQPNAGKVRVFGGDPVNPQNRMRAGAMLQVGRVPETLRVREHIDLFSSYYRNPLPWRPCLRPLASRNCGTASSAIFPGASVSEHCLRWPFAGIPTCCFSTSPRSDSMWKSRRALWEQIRHLVARGKTILLTTHYLQEADALADRIAVINQGEIIAEGTPAQIKAQTCGKRIRCISGSERFCSAPDSGGHRSKRRS